MLPNALANADVNCVSVIFLNQSQTLHTYYEGNLCGNMPEANCASLLSHRIKKRPESLLHIMNCAN